MNMNHELKRLQCLVSQAIEEKQVRKELEELNLLSEGRKTQIINKRLGNIRRQYGSEMCMDETAWFNKNSI